MRAFSYVVETDSGFAPNPFWGFCTLATCKPRIRRAAKVGDWVFGSGSVRMDMHNRIIFAMRVDEIISFELYNIDPRFEKKKPVLSGTYEERCGDNVYSLDDDNVWVQRPCFHCQDDIETDLSGENVLISQHFWYFGKKAPLVPMEHSQIIKRGRGEASNSIPDSAITGAITWLEQKYLPGSYGEPFDFNKIGFGKQKPE